MTRRDQALGELVRKANAGDELAKKAVFAWKREVERQVALELLAPAELPLMQEFFEFAYSDNGSNDPLTVLLEREANDELTLERITVGNHTTIHFIYK